MQLSVVIPAYNEEPRLPSSLKRISLYLRENFDTYEIIVVSDGSTDGTSQVTTAAAQLDPHIRLIEYPDNSGKGFAVKTGVLAAGGEYVLVSDADLSTPIEDVQKLLRALEACDVAIGSRATKQTRILKYQPWYRILLGKTFNKIVRLLAVRGISDTQCGFKCWKADAARSVFSRSRVAGFAFDVETLFLARKMGLTIQEVGVSWENDPDSKVHPIYHSLQMLKELLTIRMLSLLGRYEDSKKRPTGISS